jgi:putative glutamine amidotransferase
MRNTSCVLRLGRKGSRCHCTRTIQWWSPRKIPGLEAPAEGRKRKQVSRCLVIYRAENEVKPYLAALEAAGVETVATSAAERPRLRDFEGLVLTGGGDVSPTQYGETRHPKTEDPDPERDQLEKELLAEALELDLPVLAICRGLQLLNVFHGGDLIQHLDTTERHQRSGRPLAQPAHRIVIEPDSLLFSIAGAREWQVNSRHHQAAKRVGQNLVVSATDPEDNTIEALERPDKRFVLAVQWHPENQAMADAGQLKLFQRFGQAMEAG